eukprot:3938106-Rhodomonas_salina.6
MSGKDVGYLARAVLCGTEIGHGARMCLMCGTEIGYGATRGFTERVRTRMDVRTPLFAQHQMHSGVFAVQFVPVVRCLVFHFAACRCDSGRIRHVQY